MLADINANAIQSIMEEMTQFSAAENILVLPLDITKEEQAEAAVKAAVTRFGKLDVLINNAAIDAKFDKENTGKVNQSRFEFYPLDLLRRSVEVNLTGTVIMTQYACRQMLEQGYGNIINVASTYSIVAPNQNLYDFGGGTTNFKPIDYIASKSFIPNFTRLYSHFLL